MDKISLDKLKKQVNKMEKGHLAPEREARNQAISLPWNTALVACIFALGKLSRILELHDDKISFSKNSKGKMAEELREVADYCLRAASIIE